MADSAVASTWLDDTPPHHDNDVVVTAAVM